MAAGSALAPPGDVDQLTPEPGPLSSDVAGWASVCGSSVPINSRAGWLAGRAGTPAARGAGAVLSASAGGRWFCRSSSRRIVAEVPGTTSAPGVPADAAAAARAGRGSSAPDDTAGAAAARVIQPTARDATATGRHPARRIIESGKVKSWTARPESKTRAPGKSSCTASTCAMVRKTRKENVTNPDISIGAQVRRKPGRRPQ